MDDYDQLDRVWPFTTYYNHHPSASYRHAQCQNMAWPISCEDDAAALEDAHLSIVAAQHADLHYTSSADMTRAMFANNHLALQQHLHYNNPNYGVIGLHQIQSYSELLPNPNMAYLSHLFPTEQPNSEACFGASSMMQYRNPSAAYTPLTFNDTGAESGFIGYPSQLSLQEQRDQWDSAGPLSSPSSDGSLDMESAGSDDSWQTLETRRAQDDVDAVSNPGLTLHTMSSLIPSTTDCFNVDSHTTAQTIALPTIDIAQQSPITPIHLHRFSTPYPSESNHSQQSSETCFTPSSSSASPTPEPSRISTPSPTRCQPVPKRNAAPPKLKKAPAKVKKTRMKQETAVQLRRKGGRLGPLLPEQRRGAGEIRKIHACLRCKFLKKTCDTGETCSGCRPSHARLWQVPCTRVDVRDLGYFLKGLTADCGLQQRVQWLESNCRFSIESHNLSFSHGLGYTVDICTREVFLDNGVEGVFNLDWMDHTETKQPIKQKTTTAPLTVVEEGMSKSVLSDYLDRHIQGHVDNDRASFENVMVLILGNDDDTCFLRQVLVTAFFYYQRTKLPLVHKALKFVLAYNLTNHVLLVDTDEILPGKVDDRSSTKYGRTIAPVLIHFKMKQALGEIWRELHREVLDGLSKLYTGVYNGDKQKNWATIFVVSYLLLAVWEEMQFDAQYRKDAPEEKEFLKDMEVPTGVILGLFTAISQKLPAVREWDSKLHDAILSKDPASCQMMSELQFYAKHQGKLPDLL